LRSRSPRWGHRPRTNPDGSDGVDLYLDRDAFPEGFAGDVDPETAA
jgi:hypothetical protein